MKRKLFATLPDGTRISRTTEHDYQYVVVVMRRSGRWGWIGWRTARSDAMRLRDTWTRIAPTLQESDPIELATIIEVD